MNRTLLIRSVSVFFLSISISLYGWSQSPPQDWFNLDPKADGFYGVGTEKAYNDLLKNRTAQTVVVAVIDGGTDITHEDIAPSLWTNTKEIAGNGIDDDKNGYADDVHGWNFIGGKDGDVQYDTFELTRLYKLLHDKYGSISAGAVPVAEKEEYSRYLAIKNDYESKSMESRQNYQLYNGILQSLTTMLADIGTEDPTLDQVEGFISANDSTLITQQMLIAILKEGASVKEVMNEIREGVQHVESAAKYHFNPEYDPREIVGDNYNDVADRFYGNNSLQGPEATHGTHVAGIIAAVRNNNVGMNGIADHAQLMIIRVVPDGDERDKDVANGIRYAVDNGAKVVNMSFGKAYAYNKNAVDEAVKYAESKDVLLVHAAGNDANSNDKSPRYPSDDFVDGSTPNNWLEVGATSWNNEVAPFSDFGKKTVDVWAPGVSIYSTVPGNKYRNLQGTSMASPVAAGVAALLRSYFPQLTAPQVKEVLMKSVVKMAKKVVEPGSAANKIKKVKLKRISVTGGVVNAYKAVKLAEKITSK
ncbi:MAG: S8 family serine peptidase [Chitinophagales bacterium]|nr:S8 family serine peptidase [Chitinophagales bacterium]